MARHPPRRRLDYPRICTPTPKRQKIVALIFTFLCLIANSLYAASWEDFKANAKDAKFVYQHFFMDGGSIAYEFEYMLDGKPQSVFITDRKSKFIKPALRNLYIDIGTQGKRDRDNGFELKDEADKAFVLDFLFAFADYKEIYDTLKFFGKEASTPPTKDHPETMQERTYKYVEEMLKKNKEKRLEKDNTVTKFSVESLKALVVDSFKSEEIPEACFIGFALYDGDTPTIIMHELKAGENECALPLNMSFSGTFEPTKSAIYDFKLSSPNKKNPQEIYFTNLSTPKGFSIATAPTMLIQEENKIRPVLVVVFRYNNLNSKNLDEASSISNENYIPYIDKSKINNDTKLLGKIEKKYYSKYIDYICPNKKHIRLIAQDKISDSQILYSYALLEFYLSNLSSDIANKMANNDAVLTILNGTHEETKVKEEALIGQELYQNEASNVASRAYMENDYEYRDASMEEIFHLVHDFGIGTSQNPEAAPEISQKIADATSNALPKNKSEWGKSGLWGYKSKPWLLELQREESLEQEYFVSVLDSYYGVWQAWEESSGGMWGTYIAKTREEIKQKDTIGYAMISSILPEYINVFMPLDENFSGTFSALCSF